MRRLGARSLRSYVTSAPVRHAPRVCIIGSGPGGFYSAKFLMKARPDVEVVMVDRWPTPFGLVRSGVAPDHPEVKSVARDFESVASSPKFSFVGNLVVGSNADVSEGGFGPRQALGGPHVVSLATLRASFDSVVVACGARGEAALELPGTGLDGVLSARSFVGWYNSEPTFARLNPIGRDAGAASGDDARVWRAVVIGQGNAGHRRLSRVVTGRTRRPRASRRSRALNAARAAPVGRAGLR